MSDPQAVDLLEFERLREEIDNRTTLSNQLLSYELAALGAGIAVLATYPDVLLGLAAVSTLLWLFWIDHTTQIYKIAAYIEIKIAARLRVGGGAELLGWERFLRELDLGGDAAERALYGSSSGRRVSVQRTDWINRYTAWLLGYSTIVLLLIYAIPKLYELWQLGAAAAWQQVSILHWVRAITVVAILVAWWFARRQFIAFERTAKTINEAIISAASTRPTGDGA